MSMGVMKARNLFRTPTLMVALTALLIGLGALIGGASGLVLFALIAVVLNFAMYWFSGPMALKIARAVAVAPEWAPEPHRMVERLAGRAGVPTTGVYVTPDQRPMHSPVGATRRMRRSP